MSDQGRPAGQTINLSGTWQAVEKRTCTLRPTCVLPGASTGFNLILMDFPFFSGQYVSIPNGRSWFYSTLRQQKGINSGSCFGGFPKVDFSQLKPIFFSESQFYFSLFHFYKLDFDDNCTYSKHGKCIRCVICLNRNCQSKAH